MPTKLYRKETEVGETEGKDFCISFPRQHVRLPDEANGEEYDLS